MLTQTGSAMAVESTKVSDCFLPQIMVLEMTFILVRNPLFASYPFDLIWNSQTNLRANVFPCLLLSMNEIVEACC